jgi:hypothetical protein
MEDDMSKKTRISPNRKIKAVVDMMFDDIPYSEEALIARERIIQALDAELEKLNDGRHEDEAIEELLAKYGRLAKMAELAGYPPQYADKWRGENEVVDIHQLKKEIRRQRKRACFTAAFFSFILLQVVWIPYNIISKPMYLIGNIVIITVCLLLVFFPSCRYLMIEKAAVGNKYDTDSYRYLRSLSDRYAKRLLNSIALMFAAIFIYIALELSFYFFGNSKSAELTENLFENSIAVEIPVFLLTKNILCFRIFRRRINMPDKAKYRKHIIGIIFCIISPNCFVIFIIYSKSIFIINGNNTIINGPIAFFIKLWI